MDSEVFELAADLKKWHSSASHEQSTQENPQPIENTADIKQKRGGRRYETMCYGLNESLTLIEAATHFSGANTTGLPDVITRAFGIAGDEIDTNPYRRHLRKLHSSLRLG